MREGRITCAGAAPHEPAIYRDLFRRDNRQRTVPRIQYRSARKPEYNSTDVARQKLPYRVFIQSTVFTCITAERTVSFVFPLNFPSIDRIYFALLCFALLLLTFPHPLLFVLFLFISGNFRSKFYYILNQRNDSLGTTFPWIAVAFSRAIPFLVVGFASSHLGNTTPICLVDSVLYGIAGRSNVDIEKNKKRFVNARRVIGRMCANATSKEGTCEYDGARRATDDAWRRATTP